VSVSATNGWREFSSFRGETVDPTQRAPILDDSLELLRRFWSGEEGRWEGTHFFRGTAPRSCPSPRKTAADMGRVPLAAPATPCQGGSSPRLLSFVRPKVLGHPSVSRPTDIRQFDRVDRAGCVRGIDIVCRGVSNMIEARERPKGSLPSRLSA